MPPAGHQTAMIANHQRHLLGRVIAGGHIFVPGVLKAVGNHTMALLQPFGIGLGVVAVFVDDDIAALDRLGQVGPVVIVRRASTQCHFVLHDVVSPIALSGELSQLLVIRQLPVVAQQILDQVGHVGGQDGEVVRHIEGFIAG